MNSMRMLVGDIIRFVGLFYAVAARDTIIVMLETALDELANNPHMTASIARAKSAWQTCKHRLRIAIWLALIGALASVIIGAVGFFVSVEVVAPTLSRWVAIVGFLAFAVPFMLASGIMLWELVKGEVAKEVIAAILIAMHHGGKILKQLLPQLIVGGWNADPLLVEVRLLTTRIMNLLWSIFIGVGIAALFVFVTGIYTNPLAFFATAIACILATAWVIRYATDEWALLKWASATIIAVTLFGSAGWSVWGLYTRSDSYLEGTKPQAVARVLNNKQTGHDKQLLGAAYDDIVKVREISAKSNITKCDVRNAEALMQRANGKLNGRATLVAIPDCAAEQEAAFAKKEPKLNDAQKKTMERQEAFARVLSGKKSEKPGDRAILDGVYINAVELRDLQSRRNLDECLQGRVAALKKRIDAYVALREYVDIKIPVCKPVVAAKAPSVDDTLARAAADIQKKYGN